MHEIVFFDEIDAVEIIRKKLLEEVTQIANKLKLSFEIAEASDPFFESKENKGKTILQKMLKTKYELTIPLSNKEHMAVASFNNHGFFFTDIVKITGKHKKLASGCVALGLERWAYAFFLKHGTQKKKWPTTVVEYLKKNV